MAWLDDRIRRRAERQLAPALASGEHVVEFDIGDFPPQGEVHLVVTNRRLFVIFRGGQAKPFPLKGIVSASEVRHRVVRIEWEDGQAISLGFLDAGGYRPGFLAALQPRDRGRAGARPGAQGEPWERVRALGEPDWPRIARTMAERQLPVEVDDLLQARNGWLNGDPTDTPCTLYLTTSGYVLHVRPDTARAESIEWISPYAVERAGASRNDMGDPRLAVMWRDEDEVRGIAIDFERQHEGIVAEAASWGESWSNSASLHAGLIAEVETNRAAEAARSEAPAATAPTPPAGWHPDPTGHHERRYWDGEAWTEHVTNGGVPATDSL